MNKFFQTLMLLLIATCVFSQSPTDFVPGANIIFEDNFSQDPVGDFPAKWSTSGDGHVVQIDGQDGKWLKISQPTAVSPELKKSLPENCTIEFDLYLQNTSGIAPVIMFGLTSLSDVSNGDVYRSHISVRLNGYNESGSIVYGKNIQDMGEKKFALEGYVGRTLHVSISINKTRWRVYLDDQKVVDLPKLLTPDFRHNFFIASSAIIPAPEEGIYVSNIRIAAGDADARSLLIKQLMEQGSVITPDIQVSSQTNQLTSESQPVVDQLGQVMQQNPDMNIQINTVEEVPGITTDVNGAPATTDNGTASNAVVNKAALKLKADKIKAYIVNKFKIKMDRIITDAKVKMSEKAGKNKTANQAHQLLTEIIKL
jgi:OOP family OmpA-OmpF porin